MFFVRFSVDFSEHISIYQIKGFKLNADLAIIMIADPKNYFEPNYK